MRKALATLCLLSTVSLAHAATEVRCPRVVICPGGPNTCTSHEANSFVLMAGSTVDNNSEYDFDNSWVMKSGWLICNYIQTQGPHVGKHGEMYAHDGTPSLSEVQEYNFNYTMTSDQHLICKNNDPQICKVKTL